MDLHMYIYKIYVGVISTPVELTVPPTVVERGHIHIISSQVHTMCVTTPPRCINTDGHIEHSLATFLIGFLLFLNPVLGLFLILCLIPRPPETIIGAQLQGKG